MIKYQTGITELISEKIKNNSMPRTQLFIGEYGSGKHSLVNDISEMLGVEIEDITDSVDNDKIESIYLGATPKIYLLDIDKMSVKGQNTILKFIEEPPVSAYIILISTSASKVIKTVNNRCTSYVFRPYTPQEISEITGITDGVVLHYTNTPGKALLFKEDDISKYIDYIDRMLTLIHRASWSNIMKLESNLYFKEPEDSKLSFEKFCTVLLQRASELFREGKVSYTSLMAIRHFITSLNIPKIDKKSLFNRFIFELKEKILV